MKIEIIAVVCFVIIFAVACVVWNLIMMKQYEKMQDEKLNIEYSYYDNRKGSIELVGIDGDDNGDYDVSDAIKKIKLPDDVRIKI